jgi:hypothetical protein
MASRALFTVSSLACRGRVSLHAVLLGCCCYFYIACKNGILCKGCITYSAALDETCKQARVVFAFKALAMQDSKAFARGPLCIMQQLQAGRTWQVTNLMSEQT